MPVSIVRFRVGIDLPSRAYLDTNLFLHSRDESSPRYRPASLCLRELVRQGVELNVSALVFDELWWGLFKLSYRLLTGRELQEYKHHREVWRAHWPTVRRITEEILAWGRLRIVAPASSEALVRAAEGLVDANPLAPRDAFHLAVILTHGIPALITGDADFDAVQLPEGLNLTVVRF